MAGIQVSDEAAKKIHGLLKSEDKPDHGLRLKVVGGGCSGLSYKIDLDMKRDGDKVFENDGAVRFLADGLLLDSRHGQILGDADRLVAFGDGGDVVAHGSQGLAIGVATPFHEHGVGDADAQQEAPP